MPNFFYTARDSSGRKITGYEDAVSLDELSSRLQAKNLIVISIVPGAGGERKGAFKPRDPSAPPKFTHHGINKDDLVVFCRQLATLLGAAVTILRSLDIISKQVSSLKFFNVIKDLTKDMEAGLTFHGSLAKHPKIFSELWVNLVETGEASGNLPVILNRLAGYLERKAAFKKKIISSLMYPILLMGVSVFALLFLTVKIIPTFSELFKGFNIPLPALTRILMVISDIIRKYIIAIAAVLTVSFFLLKMYINTRKGRLIYEELQLRLPVFGEFIRALVVERFSSGISTLIESGVPILYSLEITEHSVDNLIMANIIRKVKEEVREGKSLSQSLENCGFFEPMVIQMMKVGEEIGDLPQMFNRINSFYDEYVETFLIRFTSLFEPIILVFMGFVVGIMVIGIFLPIFKIATMSGGGGG